MTREEAIERIGEQYKVCKEFYHLSANPEKDYPGVMSYMEALGMALSALRPVRREQVERMRGEWISTGAISCQCSKCKYLEFKSRAKEYSYCPCCGAPMTDEAVEMVMERMGEMKNG